MALPLPEWKEDHVFIPSELHEVMYQGFDICIKIKLGKPEEEIIIKTTIRKEKPAEKVKPEEIASMALYPQEFMPEALELLRQGFTLEVYVSLKEEPKVIAEKRL